MAQKKGPKDPFSEFIRVFEQQRKEMEKLAKPFLEYPKRMEKVVKPFLDYQQRTEKMAKPILEYQRKLFEQSKKFHEALTQNVVETIGEGINQMIEEKRRQKEEAKKLHRDMRLRKKGKAYLQNLHKI